MNRKERKSMLTKITLKNYAESNCSFILESEEAIVRRTREQGFSGNGIDDEGNIVYKDLDGNFVLLQDLVTSVDVDELKRRYKDQDPAVLEKLYKAFYKSYKFLTRQDIESIQSRKAEETNLTIEEWERLAGGWE